MHEFYLRQRNKATFSSIHPAIIPFDPSTQSSYNDNNLTFLRLTAERKWMESERGGRELLLRLMLQSIRLTVERCCY